MNHPPQAGYYQAVPPEYMHPQQFYQGGGPQYPMGHGVGPMQYPPQSHPQYEEPPLPAHHHHHNPVASSQPHTPPTQPSQPIHAVVAPPTPIEAAGANSIVNDDELKRLLETDDESSIRSRGSMDILAEVENEFAEKYNRVANQLILSKVELKKRAANKQLQTLSEALKQLKVKHDHEISSSKDQHQKRISQLANEHQTEAKQKESRYNDQRAKLHAAVKMVESKLNVVDERAKLFLRDVQSKTKTRGFESAFGGSKLGGQSFKSTTRISAKSTSDDTAELVRKILQQTSDDKPSSNSPATSSTEDDDGEEEDNDTDPDEDEDEEDDPQITPELQEFIRDYCPTDIDSRFEKKTSIGDLPIPIFRHLCAVKLHMSADIIMKLGISDLCELLRDKRIALPYIMIETFPKGWQKKYPKLWDYFSDVRQNKIASKLPQPSDKRKASGNARISTLKNHVTESKSFPAVDHKYGPPQTLSSLTQIPRIQPLDGSSAASFQPNNPFLGSLGFNRPLAMLSAAPSTNPFGNVPFTNPLDTLMTSSQPRTNPPNTAGTNFNTLFNLPSNVIPKTAVAATTETIAPTDVSMLMKSKAKSGAAAAAAVAAADPKSERKGAKSEPENEDDDDAIASSPPAEMSTSSQNEEDEPEKAEADDDDDTDPPQEQEEGGEAGEDDEEEENEPKKKEKSSKKHKSSKSKSSKSKSSKLKKK